MIEHLVVDSGGFIKNAPIRELCRNAYTIPEVVSEIKDRETRKRLKVLPYELNFSDPRPESIQKVSQAAKESGDFSALSAVDIKVLALTYQLSKEFVPDKTIRETLTDIETQTQIGGNQTAEDCKKIKGFHEGDSDSDEDLQEESDEESDDDDWITPENIEEEIEQEEEPDFVACLTTDFAMQNVLLKMDLGRVGTEGRKITNARKYILRCTGCFFVDKTASKMFCPRCGHKTMRRVACEVLPDGSVKLFLAKNPKCLNPRGTRYNLPAPKGGKYSKNPVLTDMQPMPQQKLSKKAMMRSNVMAADFDASQSPFSMNDVESTSYRLGFGRGNGRFKNQNANRPKGKRR
jgi:RNA-binding protein NOB1